MKLDNKIQLIGIILFLFRLIKPKCPHCDSQNNKIERYSYAAKINGKKRQAGRWCMDCGYFWFSAHNNIILKVEERHVY